MVAQVTAGETVDPAPGLEGKRRSIHNNYFTLPVIFLMISNHYPMIYQHPLNWLIGFFVMIISAYIRHYFNLKHIGQNRPSVLLSGACAMMVLAVLVSWQSTSRNATQPTVANADSPHAAVATEVSLTEEQKIAKQIINERCSQCHSSTPTDDVFKVAPSGAVFDSWQDIERWKARILVRSVESADMPFLNKTKMTDEERQRLKEVLN